jgi:hypothetical protein
MQDFNRFYLNSDPTAGWINYLMGTGVGSGVSPQQTWARNQQNRYYGTYSAGAGTNPDEGFFDWLLRTNPDVGNEWSMQSPEQRGDFTSRTHTPRARWVWGG